MQTTATAFLFETYPDNSNIPQTCVQNIQKDGPHVGMCPGVNVVKVGAVCVCTQAGAVITHAQVSTSSPALIGDFHISANTVTRYRAD